MKKPSLLVIFLTVFIDLIGFGVVLPLLPIYGERFGAQGIMIGVIIGSFSVMQFLFAPWWGRLSDRVGRRPVILISLAGSATSYALFALSASPALRPQPALGLLLFSRVFAGICGANIGVASAYIADVTPPDRRSKGMALIGVAFGLGFILGPAIGGLSAAYFGLAGPGWVAAALCAGNLALACFILAESRHPGGEPAPRRANFQQWRHTLRQPKVGLLVGLYFLSTLCFTCLESTLPLLVGSPSFHPDDFRKPEALAQKLATASDPMSVHLRSILSPEARQVLAGTNVPAATLRRALYVAFNGLIRSEALADSALRQQIPARPDARTPLAGATSATAGPHLSRLLLEDAYPGEIAPQRLYFDEKRVGYLFAFCGLVSAFVQGGIIGRLVKRFGEPRLIMWSLAVVALSLALLPYAPDLRAGGALDAPGFLGPKLGHFWRLLLDLGALLLALALFSGSSGVNRAPTMGLISLYAPPEEQGATLGVAQSAGTLARIIGPVFATGLYGVYPHSTYLAGAALAVAGAFLAWRYLCAGREG